jgi:site-specific DNA-methyltransferase (adenine-specific)
MLELNKIYCGDCLQIMKQMDNDSVDLVITSPPYDNLRDYKGYSFDFEGIAKELFRIIKQGGVVVWVVGDATINGTETGTSFKQALYFKEIGFNLHDTMIWRKTTVPQNSDRYEPEFEYMFVVSKGKPKTFNPIQTKKLYKDNRTFKNGQRNKDGKFAILKVGLSEEKPLGNIWAISTGGGIATKDKVAYEHPAIFPEKLAAQHITSWTNKGDLVLDPFNGSGTTTKMAKLLGRSYIGIDVSSEYCDIANQRLRQNILL